MLKEREKIIEAKRSELVGWYIERPIGSSSVIGIGIRYKLFLNFFESLKFFCSLSSTGKEMRGGRERVFPHSDDAEEVDEEMGRGQNKSRKDQPLPQQQEGGGGSGRGERKLPNRKNHDPEEEKSRQEYHQKVVDWANEPTPSEASFWVPLDLLAPKYAKLKVKARFCENIASHVKGLQIDDNDDGEYSENEVKEREEEAKATVDGYLNLLVNFGVVGALFISVLFGYAVNDLQLSAESIAFFGLIPVKVFKYLFLFCVNGSAVFSLYLIFRSVMLYKHLSFWMPDLVAQLEWVQNISITSTVIISQVVVFLVALALPFGAAAAISPIAGCISAIWVLLVFLYNRDTHFIEEQSELLLQKNTRRILQARKKS